MPEVPRAVPRLASHTQEPPEICYEQTPRTATLQAGTVSRDDAIVRSLPAAANFSLASKLLPLCLQAHRSCLDRLEATVSQKDPNDSILHAATNSGLASLLKSEPHRQPSQWAAVSGTVPNDLIMLDTADEDNVDTTAERHKALARSCAQLCAHTCQA